MNKIKDIFCTFQFISICNNKYQKNITEQNGQNVSSKLCVISPGVYPGDMIIFMYGSKYDFSNVLEMCDANTV